MQRTVSLLWFGQFVFKVIFSCNMSLFCIAIGDRKGPCYQLFWPVNFFIVMGSSMEEEGGPRWHSG